MKECPRADKREKGTVVSCIEASRPQTLSMQGDIDSRKGLLKSNGSITPGFVIFCRARLRLRRKKLEGENLIFPKTVESAPGKQPITPETAFSRRKRDGGSCRHAGEGSTDLDRSGGKFCGFVSAQGNGKNSFRQRKWRRNSNDYGMLWMFRFCFRSMILIWHGACFH